MKQTLIQDEILFKGTLADLYDAILTLRRKGVPIAMNIDGDIVLEHPAGNTAIYWYDIGNGIVRLVVVATTLNWRMFHEPRWRLIVDALQTAGFVVETNQADSSLAGKPGERDHLPPLTAMKQLYEDYNPETAQRILDNLPAAFEKHGREGGKWGPRFVAPLVGINATTVGRYFRALKQAGVTTWKDIKLP
jgi:hypothetical protein